jgi:hypothetical protein
VPKVHNKPIQVKRKGSKQRDKPTKYTEGSPGLAHPPDSVRCTREIDSEFASFGNLGGRSAIILRTVRCNTGLSGVPVEQWLLRANGRLQRTLNALQCAPAHAEVRAGTEGTPDSLQDLSGAPLDCPVAPIVRAPTVGIQRPSDVAGTPDSVRCAIRQKPSPTAILVVGAINTPQPPLFK